MEIFIYIGLLIGGVLGGLYASCVGGGALLGFPLLIMLGLPTHQAIATQRLAAMSRIVGLLLSSTTSIVFARQGLINYPYAICLGIGFAIGGWMGIDIALKKGNTYVKSLLIVVVLFSVLKLFFF